APRTAGAPARSAVQLQGCGTIRSLNAINRRRPSTALSCPARRCRIQNGGHPSIWCRVPLGKAPLASYNAASQFSLRIAHPLLEARTSATCPSIGIVAYMASFATVGIVFLLVNLLVGRLLRPANPHEEKLEIYECGEPTIGSSFVQFDLRFYVVALLFIIFDVEVAFFFPWATVFGKSTQLMDRNLANQAVARANAEINLPPSQRTDEDRQEFARLAGEPLVAKFAEMGVTRPAMDRVLEQPSADPAANAAAVQTLARSVARMSIFDIGVFFAVLMVGFFYVWRRGDLDWVRALSEQRAGQVERGATVSIAEEAPALSA